MNRKEQYYELREHFMQIASKRDDALAKLKAESLRVKRLKEENNHLLDLILVLNPPLGLGDDLESDLTDVETDVEDAADKSEISAPPQPHAFAVAVAGGAGGGDRTKPAGVVEIPGGQLAAAAAPREYQHSPRAQSPPPPSRRHLERT